MASKTALTAVITAAMAALAADATFMAASPGGVWDYVPEEPTWPYCCLESAREDPDDMLGSGVGSQGRLVTLMFTVWSQYQGRTQQLSILDSLVRVLRYGTLTITGWAHLQTRYAGAQAHSPFDAGNLRAGATSATFEVRVRDSA